LTARADRAMKRRRRLRKERSPAWQTRHLAMFARSLHCAARDADYAAKAIAAFRREAIRVLKIPPSILGATIPDRMELSTPADPC